MHLGKGEEILGKFRKILFDTAQCYTMIGGYLLYPILDINYWHQVLASGNSRRGTPFFSA